MAKSGNNHHWCFVPLCKNTSKITPEKRFITVPRDMKTRKLWWRAANRDLPITTGSSYCCEDHFNLEEDLQNYRYLVTMGGAARLKPGVLPHIFDCQGRGVTANNNRISFQGKGKIKEILDNKENYGPDASTVMASDGDSGDGNPSYSTKAAAKHIGTSYVRTVDDESEDGNPGPCTQLAAKHIGFQDTGVLSAGETSEEEFKPITFKDEEIDPTPAIESTEKDASTSTAGNVVVQPQIQPEMPGVKRNSDAMEVSAGVCNDEFHHFGMNLASQLRRMPLRAAIETQLEIQRLLTAKRLEYLD